MNIQSFPFQTFNWSSIPKEEHKGETGMAYWQIKMLNDIRIRLVEYSPGYKADHWCKKGHVLYCFEGEMETELEDGRIMSITQGMCYFVGDNSEAHRSSTVQVLLQVGYLITSRPELLPGFVLKVEVNIFCPALFVKPELLLIAVCS